MLGRRRRFGSRGIGRLCFGQLLRFGLRLRIAVAAHLCDFTHNDSLAYTHGSGALAGIHLSHNLAGNNGNAAHDVRYKPRPLYGVVAALAEQQVGLKLDKVGLVSVDVVAVLLRVAAACKRVGVFAVGQQQHFHVHALFEQHVDTAQTGFDARAVAVVKHRDVFGEAAQQVYLSRSEGRARGSHDIFNATLVH